jgi:hypothetical protein
MPPLDGSLSVEDLTARYVPCNKQQQVSSPNKRSIDYTTRMKKGNWEM